MVKKRKKRSSAVSGMTTIFGGMMAGLDEQLLRATPRIEVLVKRGKTVRGASSQGGELLVGLPDDPVVLPAAGPDNGVEPPA